MHCAAPLPAACSRCGGALPDGARFCPQCAAAVCATPVDSGTGAPDAAPARQDAPERVPRAYTPKHLADKILRSKAALEGERKQVTVLFADLKGSMDLAEQLDPEQWHAILDRFFQTLSEGVHRFEGTVNQYTGDGIMALFGAPIAHEDHAQRACYAALWLKRELQACAREVKREHGIALVTRIGLNSGEVVVGRIGDDLRMDYTALGHTVGLAQRMESLAEPGSCYLTEVTAALVSGYFDLEDLGPFRVKGVSDPVTVFELRAVGALRTRFDVSRARGLSRFVGRDTDMQTLEGAFAQAQAGNGQVVGVVAEAGTGKSRLCFEFLERCRAQGMTVLEGHAVAHGKNIPLLPVLEVFRAFYGITEQDDDRTVRERVAGRLLLLDEDFRGVLPVMFEFLGVPDPERPVARMDTEAKQRQLFAVVRRIVQSPDRGTQIVTLIEDLHWMDAASEVFLEQWVEAVAGSSVLMLVNFRPEYESAWMSRSYYRQIPLAPLGAEAVRELLQDVLGSDESVRDLAAAIHVRTGGNPFFTEEVVRTLIESGQLAGERGSYCLVGPIDRLDVPPTVQALLAARIDRIGDLEKEVLQTAAVIGKEFTEPLLMRVCSRSGAEVQAALRTLKDAEFVYEQALYPVAEYAFKHPLTQEVALYSQLAERRKHTHATVAAALEADRADRLDENAALLAHHWEEAGDARTAVRWHRRAAEWAGLKDFWAAQAHWKRVLELTNTDEGDDAVVLAVTACSRILQLGWRTGTSEEERERVFELGRSLAERVDDLAPLATLMVNYGGLKVVNQPNAYEFLKYAHEAVELADRSGVRAMRCGTRNALMYAHRYRGAMEHCLAVCAEVEELADGDVNAGAEVMGYSALIAARVVSAALHGASRGPQEFWRQISTVRSLCLEHGYPEMVTWLYLESTIFSRIEGEASGIEARAQEMLQLAHTQGLMGLDTALLMQCCARALAGEWGAVLESAETTLRDQQERRAGRFFTAMALDFVALALLEMGELEAARTRAAEGVAFVKSTGIFGYGGYVSVTLARALLELGEPAAAVEATLDEYARDVEVSGLRLFEGPIHQLRASLAEREGDRAARRQWLERARDLYTELGMNFRLREVKRGLESQA
jgi:class 3 adenylate cyclase/tetratricopeptide (TPR) repeat protein